jgi:protein RecA
MEKTAAQPTPPTPTTPPQDQEASHAPRGAGTPTTFVDVGARRSRKSAPDAAPAVQRFRLALQSMTERGAAALFGSAEPPALARLSTDIPDLDDALLGGLPVGRLVEVAGPPSSGKSSFALRVAAAVQRRGGVAAVVDADHGLERATLHRLGVDAESLVVCRPSTGEQAMHVVDELLRARAAEIIVVDSVAALVPSAELAGLTGSAPAGHLSRLMSQSLRRLTLQAAQSRAVVVFVNQFRRNWGDDGRGFDVTTGGNALVYAAATRLMLHKDAAGIAVTVKKARFGREGVVVRVPALPTRDVEGDAGGDAGDSCGPSATF